MPSYKTKLETIQVDDISLDVVSLLDKNQFYDPDGAAEKLGISDSMWPISGLIWPSGLVLAKVVNELDTSDLSILELGCGIGIASLVAAYKKADITASDFHPIVQTLLIKNAKNNNLSNVKYIHGDWNYPISSNGKFDLIIGSDLLYERDCHDTISVYIDCHLARNGKVILIDPGRRKAGKIKKAMEKLGFKYEVVRLSSAAEEKSNGYFNQYIFQKD